MMNKLGLNAVHRVCGGQIIKKIIIMIWISERVGKCCELLVWVEAQDAGAR
jgi:hypothetical protein